MPTDRILVHYTKSPEIVSSILRRGFLLVPNRRDLIGKFLDPELFADREPQQFGMVSFSEIPLHEGARHREDFGDFGVAVSWSWAGRHKAQRVIYLDEGGPLVETFRFLFELGKQEIDGRRLDPGVVPWVLTNKTMAMIERLAIYPQLLTLYEYMQPERDSAQLEWRIVSDIPGYEEAATREELIAKLLSLNDMFSSLGTVKLTPDDVLFLTCPVGREEELRALLPSDFRDVPIRTYEGGVALPVSAAPPATDQASPPGPDLPAPTIPPAPEAQEEEAMTVLPEVSHLQGARFFPNPVLKRSYLEIVYLDQSANEFLQVLRWEPMFQLTSLLYTISIEESDKHVRRLASAFRHCLDTIDRAPLPTYLKDFPKGASGPAALLLATYLKGRDEPGFEYVRGDHEARVAHAWLERNGLVVDIAGDQFEGRPAVQVSRDSDWHRAFTVNKRAPADLEKSQARLREELGAIFTMLDPLLPHW